MFMGINGFRFTTSSNESGAGLKEPKTARSGKKEKLNAEMRIAARRAGRTGVFRHFWIVFALSFEEKTPGCTSYNTAFDTLIRDCLLGSGYLFV
jgi:hypothetical protein